MGITIKDVASHAKVSPSTVSRVINQSGYVSERSRERVLHAVKELGFSPSLMAVRLSKNRMNTIGVIVPDINNSFFSEIFYAASKVAERRSYRMILCNSDDNTGLEASAIQDMISYRVSGIIITPVSDEDSTNVELLRSVQNMGIPVVFVDREMKNVKCDGVFIDNVRGSYEATDLLLREGHREIAVIAGPQDTIPGRERMTGYANALADWQVTPHPEHQVVADFKSESSYQATLKLLDSPQPPTAFFTCNNLMTLGCLRAVLSCGKKIPDDVALVGFDEIDLLDVLGYRISLVSRATTEMGTVAMRLLMDRIRLIEKEENIVSFQRVVLQSHLKVNGSEKLVKRRE